MNQSKQKWQYRVINGKHVIDSEIAVHWFEIPWSDDATLLAAEPLNEWEQSEAGKWVKEHAVETPRWESFDNYMGFVKQFAIIARLTEEDQTYFRLKFT